jgi:hypothetical protein
MAVLRGVPIAGIDLQFVRFPRVLHHCGENLARRQVKNRSRLGKRKLAHAHFEPKQSSTIAAPAPPPSFGRLPLNRSPHNKFRVPHPERPRCLRTISGHGDTIRLNETLLSQPRKRAVAAGSGYRLFARSVAASPQQCRISRAYRRRPWTTVQPSRFWLLCAIHLVRWLGK